MKVLAVIVLFSIVAYASSALINVPEVIYGGLIQGEDGKIINLAEVDTDEPTPIRHRRVTCDVLSFGTKWGSPSKVACPVRCLAQGRKGGSCRDGVCICK